MPIIVEALFKTGFLESWGTGVQRMMEACKNAFRLESSQQDIWTKCEQEGKEMKRALLITDVLFVNS